MKTDLFTQEQLEYIDKIIEEKITKLSDMKISDFIKDTTKNIKKQEL